MRMMRQRRAPGMQHQRGADASTQVLGICRDGLQHFGRHVKQQGVELGLVLICQICEGRGQREDDVVVLDGQQVGLAGLKSALGRRALALGAVPVAARCTRPDRWRMAGAAGRPGSFGIEVVFQLSGASMSFSSVHYKPLTSTMLMLAVLSGCTSGPATSPVKPPELSAPPASAADSSEASTDQRFAQWLANFRETARAAGIDEGTLHAALDNVKLRPRAVEQDRTQPEFTRTLWDYLESVISPQRVAMGRQKLTEVRAEAEAASARYGVPVPILMGVWGIESNFGRNYGDVPVLRIPVYVTSRSSGLTK